MRAGSSRGPGVREVKGGWGLASGLARQSQMWPTGSACSGLRAKPGSVHLPGKIQVPPSHGFPICNGR